ncbi:plasmid replication/partition related protein [Dyella solisilvae]|uniref:Plasmid replication/partition related protein n=1 Tax=Dyella solisilvae TaxID=1920168 RepID=A0A370K5R6_9GAMM|nr:plasmid replication/partition related protein [Dyella solisilvae]RDI97978.1 plasmid replication/partition related protein [Dyella solisilvae]
MDIVVNEELKAYIDPLTADEYEALERSLLAEGCRDALVLWGDVLVDGHNRFGICQKHGLPFQTVQNTRFASMEDVHLWMIEQHLGRRSVSDFQRGVLALRKREILAARRAPSRPTPEPVTETEAAGSAATEVEPSSEPAAPAPANEAKPAPLPSRQAIAREARISNSQVVAIEKIHKQAAPEVVAAVKAGTLSINAAAAVASLPEEEQRAAAQGGSDELKQAAKRVRESRRRPPKEAEGDESTAQEDLPTLRRRVAELTAQVEELTKDNDALRQQLARFQNPIDD